MGNPKKRRGKEGRYVFWGCISAEWTAVGWTHKFYLEEVWIVCPGLCTIMKACISEEKFLFHQPVGLGQTHLQRKPQGAFSQILEARQGCSST